MRLLILGGTVFLGRHLVEQGLAAGHEVTLFNRGQTNPELFEGQVETIVGDRNEGLGQLAHRQFDACIDPSGYLPGHLEKAGQQLKDCVEHYAFISSISVYPKFTEGMDESGTLDVIPNNVDLTTYDNQYYGAFKVLCEQAIETEMPGRVLHARSGLIVGPYDPTHRFTYWPVRVSKGGDMLAPVGPELPVQLIHAADQARWILQMLGAGKTGTFNVTSDSGTYTLGDVIDATIEVTGSDANPIWVPSDFLLDKEIAPWMGLPLWLPEKMLNMSRVSASKAKASGLQLMPLPEVIRDTLGWYDQQPERDWPAGISAERESEILRAWREKST